MDELKKQLTRCKWFHTFNKARTSLKQYNCSINQWCNSVKKPKGISSKSIKQHVKERIQNERATATRS